MTVGVAGPTSGRIRGRRPAPDPGRAIGLVAVLLMAAMVPCQDGIAAFDSARQRVAAAADPARAAGAALSQFLRLPASEARRARLPDAVDLAFAAGDHGLVLDLAAETRAAGLETDAVAIAELRAMIASARVRDFVARARAADAAGLGEAVAAALRADEALLLPAADSLLRSGGAGEDGLWIFAHLAALEPPQAVRLANLGLALRHLSRLPEAEAAYRRALELDADDAGIWNDYGLLLRATGRPDEAMSAFARSAASDRPPGAGPAITNQVLAAVLWPGGVEDPVASAARALALRPDAALLRRALIDLLLARDGRGAAPDNGAAKR